MKKYHEQHLSGTGIALFDQGSEAFRQKMCKHFESISPPNQVRAGKIPEPQRELHRRKEVILFTEPLN